MPTSLTIPSALILDAILSGRCHGFDIMDATGLPSGTVYPALRRMEKEGWIVSRWEDERISLQEQRPARRYYAITAEGEAALAEARRRYRVLQHAGIVNPKAQHGGSNA